MGRPYQGILAHVVSVQNEHSEVSTKMTKSQHSPVGLKQASLVNSLLCGPQKQWKNGGEENHV